MAYENGDDPVVMNELVGGKSRRTFRGHDAAMKKKQILIVDDEVSILVPLKFLLEKNNFNIAVAQSGRDALDQIRAEKPDLILLDIMLPDLDGYEIFQMIRENQEWDDIKVIYLTARNRDLDIAKGLNLGVDAYITKPFSNAELLERIKQLLA
jgi:DNA-binding response OmpR family regulator